MRDRIFRKKQIAIKSEAAEDKTEGKHQPFACAESLMSTFSYDTTKET